jgi:NAD+ kinase
MGVGRSPTEALMVAFGFVVHHDREEAAALAKDAIGWLRDDGHDVRVLREDAVATGLDEHASDASQLLAGLDVAVSLGGDGTMLRTLDLVGATGVPVLGVNVGQLGYLTEVDPPHMRDALAKILAGSYAIEERMLLQVHVAASAGWLGPDEVTAFNEAVIEKTPIGHTVRLGVDVDGEFFTTYAADGLIVATPTGSTAYSFSARGPIVAPTHRALVLTPVSPHMLFDRALVLDPEARLRVEVAGARPATLSVDGRTLGTLSEGDAVVCTAAARSARLVVFGPRDFLRILKTKFGLEDR